MELSRPPLVVAFELSEKRKAIVADALAGASAVVYLTELDEAARAEALRNTGALLTFNTSKELRSGEAELLDGAWLIQFMIAGVDFIPLGELPEGVPVATNGGGYAESMAEHALAMALAPALTPFITLYAREGADGQAVVCPLLRGSSPPVYCLVFDLETLLSLFGDRDIFRRHLLSWRGSRLHGRGRLFRCCRRRRLGQSCRDQSYEGKGCRQRQHRDQWLDPHVGFLSPLTSALQGGEKFELWRKGCLPKTCKKCLQHSRLLVFHGLKGTHEGTLMAKTTVSAKTRPPKL